MNLELPFVINGNFILTASRQSAQNSDPWNAFLFQSAGFFTATWLAELAGTPTYRRTFTRLLPPAVIHGGNAHLHGLYTPQFKAAFKQVPTIPSASGKLVKLDSAIWDTLGVFSALGDPALKQFDGLQDASLIDAGVEQPEKLVQLGLTKIAADDLEEVLAASTPLLSEPDACLKLSSLCRTRSARTPKS
ncbi:hypothetical protein [Nannocystis pusilla]|uniref:hypothetical protein n=1 Tax=Nannocystis pusilla TaxID=889268 RepID=UPI003B80C4EE